MPCHSLLQTPHWNDYLKVVTIVRFIKDGKLLGSMTFTDGWYSLENPDLGSAEGDSSEEHVDPGLEAWLERRERAARRFERIGTKPVLNPDGSRRFQTVTVTHFEEVDPRFNEGERERETTQVIGKIPVREDFYRPITGRTFRRRRTEREGPSHIRNYRPEMPQAPRGLPDIGQVPDLDTIAGHLSEGIFTVENGFWHGTYRILGEGEYLHVDPATLSPVNGSPQQAALEWIAQCEPEPRYTQKHGNRDPQTMPKIPYADLPGLRKRRVNGNGKRVAHTGVHTMPKSYLAGMKDGNPGHERTPPVTGPHKNGSTWCIVIGPDDGPRSPSQWSAGQVPIMSYRGGDKDRYSPGFGRAPSPTY